MHYFYSIPWSPSEKHEKKVLCLYFIHLESFIAFPELITWKKPRGEQSECLGSRIPASLNFLRRTFWEFLVSGFLLASHLGGSETDQKQSSVGRLLCPPWSQRRCGSCRCLTFQTSYEWARPWATGKLRAVIVSWGVKAPGAQCREW